MIGYKTGKEQKKEHLFSLLFIKRLLLNIANYVSITIPYNSYNILNPTYKQLSIQYPYELSPKKYIDNDESFNIYLDNYNKVSVNKVFYREIDYVQQDAVFTWSKPETYYVRIDKKVVNFDLSKIFQVLGIAIEITTKKGKIKRYLLYRGLAKGWAVFKNDYGDTGYPVMQVGLDQNNNTIYVVMNYTSDTPFSDTEFGQFLYVDYEKIIFTTN